MARQLDLSLGDEVVLVVPAADGSMGNDLYTLVGIFKSGTPAIDAAYALADTYRAMGVKFVPTGGITAATAASYLALDNVFALGGSWISPAKLLQDGDFDAIEQRAREAMAL